MIMSYSISSVSLALDGYQSHFLHVEVTRSVSLRDVFVLRRPEFITNNPYQVGIWLQGQLITSNHVYLVDYSLLLSLALVVSI